MRPLPLVLIAVALFCGCAARKPGGSSGFFQHRLASKVVEQAVEKLARGDTPGAARLLKTVCAGEAQPGVTDEALFRLALLSLKPGEEKPASAESLHLLKRLRKEYPASPWTAQAAALVALINVSEEFRRQNRNLKSANQALTREIGEQNRQLQQLKRLDQELEQKSR